MRYGELEADLLVDCRSKIGLEHMENLLEAHRAYRFISAYRHKDKHKLWVFCSAGTNNITTLEKLLKYLVCDHAFGLSGSIVTTVDNERFKGVFNRKTGKFDLAPIDWLFAYTPNQIREIKRIAEQKYKKGNHNGR